MTLLHKTNFVPGLLFCSLIAIAPSAWAQVDEVEAGPATGAAILPDGGKSLLPSDALASFQLQGKAASSARVEIVDAAGPGFARALRVTMNARSGESDVLLTAPTTSPFRGADTLHIRFWARAMPVGGGDASNVGGVSANVQAANDFERGGRLTLNRGARLGAEWRRFDAPVLTLKGANRGAGTAVLKLSLGGAPRVVEIGGVQLLNYEQRRFPHQLPHPPGKSYEGREADAPWRQAAAERIERIRKGDLTVRVVDAAGRPLPNARVKVKMTRHAFSFGTAINDAKFASGESAPDGQRFRAEIVKNFNSAVLEGGHKWKGWSGGEKNRQPTREVTRWMNEHGVQMRGHVMVWPGWNNLPASLKTGYETRQKQDAASAKIWLQEQVLAHIREIGGEFKGQLSDWDVVNETTTNHSLQDILGESAMIEWFKAAREAVGPNVPLYLNEFNNQLAEEKHTDNFERNIKLLLDGGAPLSGLGFQAHGGPRSIPGVLETLDRFGKYNLPIKITEFDIVTDDEQLQADYTRDLLTAVFSHPQSAGFLMWGFWDGRHWLGDAPMFYPDWTLKPSGQAWIDLTQKTWWTNADGQTGATGAYKTRGFLGDYEITVTAGGKTKSVKTRLEREGRALTVALG